MFLTKPEHLQRNPAVSNTIYLDGSSVYNSKIEDGDTELMAARSYLASIGANPIILWQKLFLQNLRGSPVPVETQSSKVELRAVNGQRVAVGNLALMEGRLTLISDEASKNWKKAAAHWCTAVDGS